ncbi:MAG: magnesium transporter [Phycisphaerales bacterium JB039]
MAEATTHADSAPRAQFEELVHLLEAGDGAACAGWLDRVPADDLVHDVAQLTDAQRVTLATLLQPGPAAELVDRLPWPQAVELLRQLPPADAARILQRLPSDDQADLLLELDQTAADAILGELAPGQAEEIRRLAAYDDDVAGGLMITEYLAFPAQATVTDVLADIQRNADAYRNYDIQYIYVTDEDRLAGVLPLRTLLLAARPRQLRDVMIADPVRIHEHMELDKLKRFFDEHPFLGLPVVDDVDRLVGVVRRAELEEARAEESESQYRLSQGIVGGEELRSMPLLLRSRRRLAWLSVNIVLNIIAASVIALHQDTLEAVIALAVFLPIISDMSGCSGNQAVAVSMRELTLGVARPRDLLRVAFAEVKVGLINGIALGGLIGLVAWVWQANAYLGLVVGLALMLNTIVAVLIGGSVPLVLKRLGADPAIGAGPILTTITDMCGFFLVLTLAAQMLDRLA